MGQKPVKSSMLRPGDHIYRIIQGFGAFHHGIYVGNNMVIHLVAPEKGINTSTACDKCGYKADPNGGIVKTCIDCFLCGMPLYICEYVSSNSKSPDEVVDAATTLLTNGGFGKYNLVSNNCEHFAVYCKTGRAISWQVLRAAGVDGIAASINRTAWMFNLAGSINRNA